jgi:hypothetical protein
VPTELERNPFAVAWWPVDVAIAWIITRDRTFVERHWRRRGSTLAVTIALAVDTHSGQSLRRFVESNEEAWTELKALLEAGKIRVVGTPFRRLADASAGSIETTESQREISDAEIGSLQLVEEGDDLCLIPEDWRVARGSNWNNLRGYRNPLVRANGVLHFFQIDGRVLPSGLLGPPENPHLPGVMSVSQAAYWIASQGGQILFDLREEQRWINAFNQLLPLICDGKITVVGRRDGKGLAEQIRPTSFAGLAVDYPYSETSFERVTSNQPHLRCYGIADKNEWELRINDELVGDNWRVPEFTHLQIVNADLARHFPFDTAADSKSSKHSIRSRIREVVNDLWPDGKWPARVKERDEAIRAQFERNPPNERTIRRALSKKL